MTVLFTPGIIAPGDDIGFGHWLNTHYLEHQQFVDLALANNPIIFLPEFDMMSWVENDSYARQNWLDMHQKIHEFLRTFTAVDGIDLSAVEWDNDASFVFWMDEHDFEHQQLRAALGIT